MIGTVITSLCTIILVIGEASAQNVIKRGQHPYVAFIYYTDETLSDVSGERFLQSAVLIKLEWLVSSSLDSLTVGGAIAGFPEKTLLARAGATTIDSNFTLNEDDGEQEREVVQVVRPYGHVAEKAVLSDITLLKTLLPFVLSPAVGLANTSVHASVSENTCSIIVYNQRTVDERALIEIAMEMNKSKEQCGHEFVEGLMACGYDSEESKMTVIDQHHYCHGNAGGPLICEGKVAGIQSYIGQVCRQPHLFNLFSGWNNFITCGIESKCNDISCQNVCAAAFKDATKATPESVEVTSYIHEVTDSSENNDIVSESETAILSTLAVLNQSTSDALEEATLSTGTSETSHEESTNATKSTAIEPNSTTKEQTTATEATTSTTETSVTTNATEAVISTAESTLTSAMIELTNTTVPERRSNDKNIMEIQATYNEGVETTPIKTPDLVRKPKIEAQSDAKIPKKNPKVSLRQNQVNSSSARYMNGLLIIFLNMVVAF